MMRVWLIKCVLPYLTNDSPKGVQSMFAVARTSATFISSSNSITATNPFGPNLVLACDAQCDAYIWA